MPNTDKQALFESGFRWLWITILFFAADQYTKHLVVVNFAEREVLEIVPYFNLTLAYYIFSLLFLVLLVLFYFTGCTR